ncbi:MAG: NmrA/HSCARG family protein [Vicinamibacteria bacterium]|nr:NmrA/HSCARG family protein [Vicinamibacteria bacterium]
MSEKQVIAVVGATGAQGGGLVEAILGDPQKRFVARVLTRNPESDKAKALRARGAEVVAADVDDAASLTRAFTGAHGAFCVTFFWDHFSPAKELAQAKAMAEAAKAAGVEHVVWSTLEDTRTRVPLDDPRMPTLQGQYKVPHFDAKGEANRFFVESGVPTTLFHTSFYWDNLIHFGMAPQRGADGKLAFVLPMADKKLPGIAAEDIGRCAFGVFAGGAAFHGKSIGVAGEHPTGSEMAATLARVLGQEIVYSYVPPEVYRTFGFPGADDLGNMFQFKRDFEAEFTALRDVARSRALNPGLMSFEQWVTKNKERIPLG